MPSFHFPLTGYLLFSSLQKKNERLSSSLCPIRLKRQCKLNDLLLFSFVPEGRGLATQNHKPFDLAWRP
jgi:hypothetical protein